MSLQAEDALFFRVHSSIDDAGLSLVTFRVLGHLARRADNKKHQARTSIRTIAKHCGLNWHTVIDSIRELEEFGLIAAKRMPGQCTCYDVFPKSKARSAVSKTAAAKTESGTHLGTGVLPSEATVAEPKCCSDRQQSVAPTGNGALPLEATKGYPIKEIHRRSTSCANAQALSPSSFSGNRKRKSGDTPYSEQAESSVCSVIKSETKSNSRCKRAKPAGGEECTFGGRPESEAEDIDYLLSRGYKEEDAVLNGQYFWELWNSNGFTNNNQPIRDWKALIRSRECQGYLPSQKKAVQRQKEAGERAAKNGSGRNCLKL